MSADAILNGDQSPNGGPGGVNAPGYRLPAAIRLGPVKLQIANLERSLDFYQRVIGFETIERHPDRASLGSVGSDLPVVELCERAGASPVPPRGRLGLYHYALRLPRRPALGRFLRHLQAKGLRVGMADHLVSEAIYLNDPDGLGIEVYFDRPRSEWRRSGGQLVMTTDPLDAADLLSQSGDEPFEGMPRGTVVGHVHLHVGNLREAEAFYHAALGFDKVVWNYPGALFLSAGGYHHHLGVNTWAANAAPAGSDDARLVAWTVFFPKPGDAKRAAESIEAAGFQITASNGDWCAVDPWGTAVELRDAAKGVIPDA